MAFLEERVHHLISKWNLKSGNCDSIGDYGFESKPLWIQLKKFHLLFVSNQSLKQLTGEQYKEQKSAFFVNSHTYIIKKSRFSRFLSLSVSHSVLTISFEMWTKFLKLDSFVSSLVIGVGLWLSFGFHSVDNNVMPLDLMFYSIPSSSLFSVKLFLWPNSMQFYAIFHIFCLKYSLVYYIFIVNALKQKTSALSALPLLSIIIDAIECLCVMNWLDSSESAISSLSNACTVCYHMKFYHCENRDSSIQNANDISL